MGSDNIPGYEHVDRLAEYLVQLKDHARSALTIKEATKIVQLWHYVSYHDKTKIEYSARHSTKLCRGRFTACKKSNVVPGVDSTKRYITIELLLFISLN